MKKSNSPAILLVLAGVVLFSVASRSDALEDATVKERIVASLEKTGIPEELIVVVVSALPIFELRGGIPLALYTFDMSYARSYFLSVVGNLIPVIPLLLLLTTLSRLASRFPPFGRALDWFFRLTRRRGGLIERYEALGLVLFVATPLPVTGAWTGAVASVLFGMRFRMALPSISAGVLIAGLIVSSVCWLGINLFS